MFRFAILSGRLRPARFASKNNLLLSLLFLPALPLAFYEAQAQTLSFTSVPSGYDAGSIDLPEAFAGALGVDPDFDHIVYAAVGSFQNMKLAKVDLRTGEVKIVANGPFGAIGGIAPLGSRRVVIVDNATAEGGPTDDTILIAYDKNSDGDFNDAKEITQLVKPILSGGNWSGSQARLIPSRPGSALTPGSVMIQTADGNGAAELLVIENPKGKAKFAKKSPFFGGFDYNGGFDFDSSGRVLMGTLTGSFTGEIFVLVDRNRDRRIGEDESNLLVEGEGSMGDMIVDHENDVIFLSFDDSFQAALKTFRVPADPLKETATPEDFAATDSGYLYSMVINSKQRSFEPDSGPSGAMLIFGGLTGTYESAVNLLTLTPSEN